MHAAGVSSYRIAKTLNAEGICTPYGKQFTTTTVQNILKRGASIEASAIQPWSVRCGVHLS